MILLDRLEEQISPVFNKNPEGKALLWEGKIRQGKVMILGRSASGADLVSFQ